VTHVQLIVGGDVIELSLLTYHGPRFADSLHTKYLFDDGLGIFSHDDVSAWMAGIPVQGGFGTF
jgi:hypothetical protein